MAALPKKRHSKSRRNNRRSHHVRIARELVSLSKCSNCGALKKPHRVCSNCGYYKGHLVRKAI
ncbi:MAG: 50S ribosomal protein L32 [Candidatus Dojkabacteria bacterium]|nr:50S ribosomal protein L32 [Candidatus Dojkabacteria bacterium]